MPIATQNQLDTQYAELFCKRVAANLFEARLSRGLTNEDIAERTGIKLAKVIKIQRGNMNGVSLKQLIDFALACQAMPLEVSLRRKQNIYDALGQDELYAPAENYREEPDAEDPDIQDQESDTEDPVSDDDEQMKEYRVVEIERPCGQ